MQGTGFLLKDKTEMTKGLESEDKQKKLRKYKSLSEEIKQSTGVVFCNVVKQSKAKAAKKRRSKA